MRTREEVEESLKLLEQKYKSTKDATTLEKIILTKREIGLDTMIDVETLWGMYND